MIVVDTNILVYFKLQTEKSDLAEKAYQKDPVWLVPLLWRSEFANVLGLYLRKNIISLEEAKRILDDAISLVAGEYQAAPEQILDLVSASTCSAYDCEFVALARELEIQLLTSDQQVMDQFPETAISLEKFLELDG
jgi:predicted nucleic acid-binding protein